VFPSLYQLYLPKDWASDTERRRKAGVPSDQVFATKPEIAPGTLRAAIEVGVPPGVVWRMPAMVTDGLRDGITEMGCSSRRHSPGNNCVAARRVTVAADTSTRQGTPVKPATSRAGPMNLCR